MKMTSDVNSVDYVTKVFCDIRKVGLCENTILFSILSIITCVSLLELVIYLIYIIILMTVLWFKVYDAFLWKYLKYDNF